MVMAKLRCAAGLAAMDGKKYKQAALRFTEVANNSLSEDSMHLLTPAAPHRCCASSRAIQLTLRLEILRMNSHVNLHWSTGSCCG